MTVLLFHSSTTWRKQRAMIETHMQQAKCCRLCSENCVMLIWCCWNRARQAHDSAASSLREGTYTGSAINKKGNNLRHWGMARAKTGSTLARFVDEARPPTNHTLWMRPPRSPPSDLATMSLITGTSATPRRMHSLRKMCQQAESPIFSTCRMTWRTLVPFHQSSSWNLLLRLFHHTRRTPTQ